MELGFGPPDGALARELRQVARAAEDVLSVIGQLNNALPEAFPQTSLVELCRSLAGLPDGTAESCRVELEHARSFLPRLRRLHFEQVGEGIGTDEDGEPAPQRGDWLDKSLQVLLSDVTTALEEYRAQAQIHTADEVEAERPLPANAEARAALGGRAAAVVKGASSIAGRLDREGLSETESGEVLRRRVKDTENLSRAARAQLAAPTVDRVWLTRLQAALSLMPPLIKGAAQTLKMTVKLSRPFLKWFLTAKHGALDTLADSAEGFCDAIVEAVQIWDQDKAKSEPKRPDWAVDGGEDEHGKWLDFEYKRVRQRMRWIPPGRFLMGSPENEEGRSETEEPQHEVVMREGFWLFDTPVTQALYAAVVGENPSGFEGQDRPVESVRWFDAQWFLERLNSHMPGLALRLPSEAEWEYACRAGTTAATYAAPLADIAWFDENSGGKTHPVRGKAPNRWGLYDMLGNVLEWCADYWHHSYDGAPNDGSARRDANVFDGALRVVRGGSWDDLARDCRAAYRYGYPSDGQYDFLGFRPARRSRRRRPPNGA